MNRPNINAFNMRLDYCSKIQEEVIFKTVMSELLQKMSRFIKKERRVKTGWDKKCIAHLESASPR